MSGGRASEEDLARELVRDVAALWKWSTYHTHDSRRSDKGWPDEVYAKDGQLVVVEWKSATGKATAEQWHWLRLLDLAGVEVHLWRPADVQLAMARLDPRTRSWSCSCPCCEWKGKPDG